MSRVSVAAGAKPRPKESFKFLRRDEGRLSYAAAGTADSPSCSAGNGSEGDRVNRERRDSKSLREAIAFDMRNARSHDPLGEVVVAVPRKAPPPNRAASTPPPPPASRGESPAPPAHQRRPPAAAATKRKPEWVSLEVPPPRAASAAAPAPAARDDALPSEEGEGWGRYGGVTPRRGGSGAAPPRHVDVDYDDLSAAPSSAADRNYFRRPPSQQPPSAVSSRGREEEDLMLNLEQEIRAAQEEREHYASAKQQLDRERQRFDAYRYNTQQQMEEERAEGGRQRDRRDSQRDIRAVEERYRNVSALLVTEREAGRRLSQENDALRAQLEDLTSTLRETQQVHKTEVARMRRDVESLTRRNAELLAMAKETQIAALSETPSAPTTAPALRKGTAASRNASAARERSATNAAPTPSLDAADLTEPERRMTAAAAPGVMDFTPRANAAEEAARERRNRQMQERIHAERAEMDERRRQREREAAAKRSMEEETRQRAAAEAAAQAESRQRAEAAAAAAAAEAEEQRRRQQEQREASVASTKPVEERKSAGHPVNTPRMQAGSAGGGNGGAAVKKRPSAAAAAAAATATPSHPPPVPPKSSSRLVVPTRAELLGDVEPPPMEDAAKDGVVSTTALGDNPNKRETLYRSGKREIHYANGTVKAVLPSGHTILHFTNGDIKCTFPSGKSTYWYDAAQTMHTQMPDGVQTFEFRTTGQAERHQPDGGKSILYPDGIYKVVRKDGTDETYYPDGELMEE